MTGGHGLAGVATRKILSVWIDVRGDPIAQSIGPPRLCVRRGRAASYFLFAQSMTAAVAESRSGVCLGAPAVAESTLM